MDERYIPDPVIKPEYKKRQHRGQKGLVCEFVLKRLKEGRLSDQQIAEECSILYDGSTSVKAVQWYKHHYRKTGELEPSKRRRSKRKYLTEFTFEIIFKLLDPPDNVEVVNSRQLVEFAQKIVKRYAKYLPKEVEELVYDIKTAIYYLKATGKFDVIDQNNYDDPFYYVESDPEEDDEDFTDEELDSV